jgi:hexosaminidase
MDLPPLVPLPRRVDARPGTWSLRPDATVSASEGAGLVVRSARSLLGPATGYDLPAVSDAGDLQLYLDDALDSLGPEGYRLAVTPERAVISSAAPAGLINGLQTLRQLFGTDILRRAAVAGAQWSAPCVEIEDAPRFAWRGLHLDVARHFFPIDFLHRFVDLLALHKLNVFHLHLNDDQGWRFPSERYPRLCEIGAARRATPIGYRGRDGVEPTPHGGCYRKDELVDLVTHAAARNVTIVPEIDLPGHASAVLAAYPELGNGTGPYEVWTSWGISTQVLNVEEETVEFCRHILGEVMEVFPSRYIHVGGDEVPKDEWRASPAARTRKSQLGLSDDDQLQHWFTEQLNAFLSTNRRALVGWDEILEGGEPPEGATVMSWRGVDGGVRAARAGRDVVMSPGTPLYLDHYQSDDDCEPLAIGGRNTLADICAYDPIPAGLDPAAARRVLGAQVQLWTEYMPDTAAVDYMAFPRTSAFADVMWAGAGVEPAERAARIGSHLARLDVLGVRYRPLTGPLPWQQGGLGRRRRPDRSLRPAEQS